VKSHSQCLDGMSNSSDYVNSGEEIKKARPQ